MRKFALTCTAGALALTLSAGGEFVGMPLVSRAQAQSSNASAPLSMPQLQSLVAPIALYPDSLLSQVLMASTYPLEAAAWRKSNTTLSGTALDDALKAQSWDNSVKSLISFPDALNTLGSKLDWTQRLGDAYLAQPKDTMQAVQALRAKAKQNGNLKSGQQIAVTTDPESNIIIVPANPQVVYVPTYNPAFVYGTWPYPAYPPAPAYYSGGEMAAVGLLSFGAGMAVGAALWSTPHWGSGSITVNNTNFNNFNHSTNSINNMAAEHVGGSSNWNYNAAHRDGVPYSNSALNNRYGNPAAQSQIERNQAQHYQNAKSDWNQKATPEEKQQAQQARQKASSDWNDSHASQERDSQQKQNQQRDSQQNQDQQRESQQRENQSRESRPSHSGGFGGGHMGGFRR